jgi:tRNA(fMet)-specific endonuclease VapC
VYLLDTNIISYSLYHPETYPHLVKKMRTVKQRLIFVADVTAQELLHGELRALSQSANQKYPKIVERHKYFNDMLNLVLSKLQIKTFDDAAYREFEKLPKSVRRGYNDKRIAAIALANKFILVTANVQHFEDIPNLVIQDWATRPLE